MFLQQKVQRPVEVAWAPTSSSYLALPASTWMIVSRQAWGTTHDLLSDLLKGDYIKEYIGDYYIGSQEGITAVLTEKRASAYGGGFRLLYPG